MIDQFKLIDYKQNEVVSQHKLCLISTATVALLIWVPKDQTHHFRFPPRDSFLDTWEDMSVMHVRTTIFSTRVCAGDWTFLVNWYKISFIKQFQCLIIIYHLCKLNDWLCLKILLLRYFQKRRVTILISFYCLESWYISHHSLTKYSILIGFASNVNNFSCQKVQGVKSLRLVMWAFMSMRSV